MRFFAKDTFYRFFISIDWDEVIEKKLIPPILPTVSSEGDARNFEEYKETLWSKEKLSEDDLLLFQDF